MSDIRRRKWAALATIWTLAIMALCWLPMPFFSMGGVGERAEGIPNIDKVIHAGIFAIFGLLWLQAIPGKGRFVVVAVAGVALAAITEVVQSLPMLDREGDFVDAASDATGVLAACAFVYLVLRGNEAMTAPPKPVTDA